MQVFLSPPGSEVLGAGLDFWTGETATMLVAAAGAETAIVDLVKVSRYNYIIDSTIYSATRQVYGRETRKFFPWSARGGME